MEKDCERCQQTLAPVYCWNYHQPRTCLPTVQNAGPHITLHMHSPLCGRCKVKPALLQCFTHSSILCYSCFVTGICLSCKHHVSLIQFSYHKDCSATAETQQLPAAGNQAPIAELHQSRPTLPVPLRQLRPLILGSSSLQNQRVQFPPLMIGSSSLQNQRVQFPPLMIGSSSLQNQRVQNAPFSVASSSQAYPAAGDNEEINPAAGASGNQQLPAAGNQAPIADLCPSIPPLSIPQSLIAEVHQSIRTLPLPSRQFPPLLIGSSSLQNQRVQFPPLMIGSSSLQNQRVQNAPFSVASSSQAYPAAGDNEEMGKGCEKCARTLVPVYCWDTYQVNGCSLTHQNAGSHIKLHTHSPVCDVCKVQPALIQCFTEGSSSCYPCFLGHTCVRQQHHLSIIPFSSHHDCSAALTQQPRQSLIAELLQSIPPHPVPACPPWQNGQFWIASSSHANPAFAGLVARDAEQIEPAAGDGGDVQINPTAGDGGDVQIDPAAGDEGDVPALLDLFPVHPSKKQKRE